MSRFAVALILTVALALVLPVPLLAQPPVMGIYGSATMGGQAAPEGTEVAAYIEGNLVTQATVSGGVYILNIVQPTGAVYQGKQVTFTLGGESAAETTVWQAGLNRPLNLTLPDTTLLILGLSSIAGQYTIVWMYDARTQRWLKYDPAAPAASDLSLLKRGQGYWIRATQDTIMNYGSKIYPLSQGWNLIGWLG